MRSYRLVAEVTLRLQTTIEADTEMEARKAVADECLIHGQVVNANITLLAPETKEAA